MLGYIYAKACTDDKIGYFVGITTKTTLLSTAHLRSQGQGVKLNSEQSRRVKTTQREKKKVKEKRGMEMEKK